MFNVVIPDELINYEAMSSVIGLSKYIENMKKDT